MAFEQTWRWFGPNDGVTLKEIKQTGATGIVTALHQIPVGEIWAEDEITARKKMIEAEGMTWSVVESLPVHENIKKKKGNYLQLIENYKESIKNLGNCGIDIICYNFMPVLDWSRTDLNVEFRDGSITSRFESKVFAAFDLFILERDGAEQDYPKEKIDEAKKYFGSLDDEQKKKLKDTVLLGLPGSLEAYTLEEFRKALSEYENIGSKELMENLQEFLMEIIPVAEKSGVLMAIHPDDPPFSLLGLPRVVSNKDDLSQIVKTVNSISNGITLCTGSLGAGLENNLNDIAESFADKINFVHLRNVIRNANGDFMEENHLDGDIDIYDVMKTLLIEQKRRADSGEKNARMPLRPDHGHLMLPDQHRRDIYPGYSLFGRMRGLAELRGLEVGIAKSLGL